MERQSKRSICQAGEIKRERKEKIEMIILSVRKDRNDYSISEKR